MDDLRRLDGGLVERRIALGVDDLAARGGHEVVEPHDVALVLLALLEDVARGRRQLLGHLDHLVPRLGRCRDEVLAVPEQLHVGVRRDAVDLVLPGHGRGRPWQDVVERVLLVGAGHLLQPSRLGELRRVDGVHVDDVHVLVARREAPDEQLARGVGAVADGEHGDLVLAVGGRAALLRGSDVGPARVERTVVVQGDRTSAVTPAARDDDGAYGGQDGHHARTGTPHEAPLSP